MTTETNTLEVANEIQRQIGNRAFVMMGAINLMGDEKSLTFKIAGCKTISHIRVTLDALTDTYRIEFIKCRGVKVTPVHTAYHLQCSQLNGAIEEHTGLALSL
jgi:uncharacterized protein YxjI